ncbi:MAG: PAS domain S-box protein [Burkholderiaceae bacterium]|nr:PAS domain S-box protein [Burkholderiaceae bacterium]
MTEQPHEPARMAGSARDWTLWVGPVLLWIAGASLSLGLFSHVHREADLVARLVFEQQSQGMAEAIRQDAENRIKSLQATSAWLRSTADHDAGQFARFIEGLDLPTEHPALRSIWFVGPDKQAVRYAMPDQELVGWSLAAQPALQQAMDRARARGAVVWSDTFDAGVYWLPGALQALVWPVYGERVIDDLNARLATNQGWLLAVFNVEETLHFALRRVTHQLSYTLSEEAEAGLLGESRYHTQQRIRLGTREWVLHTASTPAFEQAYWRPWPSWGILLAGLLTTLLAGFLLHRSLLERQRIRTQSQAMAQQRDTFEEVARHTASAMVLTDGQDRVQWVNNGFVQLTGLSADDALGRYAREVMALEQAPARVQAELDDAMASRSACQVDVQLCQASGRRLWVRMELRPRWNAAGTFDGFLRILTDIDDQRTNAEVLQQALAENDSIMRALNSYAIVSETDPGGRITRANDQFVRISGYDYHELLGQSHRLINSGHHPPAFWKSAWETIASGRPWRGEVCNRAKNGRLYWVNSVIAPVTAPDGRIERYVSIRFDITDLVEARQRVISNERILRAAIEAIDEGFVLYDPDDRLILCNDRFREVYPGIADLIQPGVTFEALVRASVQRGLFPLARGREEAWIAERLAIHRQDQTEAEQLQSDGRWVRVTERKTPDGHTVGFRVDITRLKQAVAEAEAASRSKSQFLANMSHEIRTPMNAILGLLQLLAGTPLSTMQQDYVTKTEGAARSLLSILNDILDFSKVEAGKMSLDVAPHRIEQTLSELAVILSGNLAGKPVDLLYDIDPQLPSGLVYDAMRLKQVLINLGGNAIKFTAHGYVLIRVQRLALRDDVAQVRIAVQDTGIGIPEAQQALIFEGFSQAEASTSRRFGGTGLGLAISRRLVQLMGADLTLRSQHGQGSEFAFTVELPVSDARTLGCPQAGGLPQVLVLDDQPVARQTHLSQLTWLGFEAEGVGSLAEAAAWLDHLPAATRVVVCLDREFVESAPEQERRLLFTALGARAVERCVWLSSTLAGSWSPETLLPSGVQPHECRVIVRPVMPQVWQQALLDEPAPRPAPGQPAAVVHGLVGLRLLLVEDNVINQQVATGLLARQGATLVVAQHGQEAVEILRHQPQAFDAVLMDMQMPVMDGLEATAAIRGELGLRDLPIIAMTANAMPADRAACLQAGMNDHIGKPFEVQRLVEVILYWAGRQPQPPVASNIEAPPGEQPTLPAAFPGFEPEMALQRLGGDQTLLARLLRQWMADVGPLLDELPPRRPGPLERATLQRLAHTVKGTAATLGLSGVSAIAAQVEQALRTGASAAAETPLVSADAQCIVQPLTDALQHAVGQLQRWCAAWGPVDSPSAPSTPPSEAACAQALEQLCDCLQRSDMEALRWFELLQAGVPDAQQRHPPWHQLRQAIQQFDFETALQAAQAIHDQGLYPSKSAL